MRTIRLVSIAVSVIAVASVAFTVLPFHAEIPIHGTTLAATSLRLSCGAPIADAWHKEHTTYLSFSPTDPRAPDGVGCVRPARERLAVSSGGLVFALLLGVVVRLRRRRPRDQT